MKKLPGFYRIQKAFWILFLILGSISHADVKEEGHPNIALVFCDDLGDGDVQCLNPGKGMIPTPSIGRLAREGMIFTDAHAGAPVCTPTRYGLLTGRYSWRTPLQSGVVKGFGPNLIAEDRPTVADYLQDQGYHTAIIGKWHLDFQYTDPQSGEAYRLEDYRTGPPVGALIPDRPITRGFDSFHGFHHSRQMTSVIGDDRVIEQDEVINMLPRITRESIAYIEERARNAPEQPFFLYMALNSPHISPGSTLPKVNEASGEIEAQLYNMKDDPSETNNLYEERPEVARRLLQQLEAYVHGGRSTPGPESANDFSPIDLWKSGRDESPPLLWQIDSSEEWEDAAAEAQGLFFSQEWVRLEGDEGFYRSAMQPLPPGSKLASLTLTQAPLWQNWSPAGKVIPSNLRDAPVFLALGPGNYWIFGRYGESEQVDFVAEAATLEGFDVPLRTTPFPKQFNAPGGLKKSLGGYHAWQSRDMEHWVHHGPVTDRRAGWVTTAEAVDGEVYLYYDFPNDQDPHLIIDRDLTDGIPGEDMGMVFADPSDGSDIAVIRDEQGRFHLFYEDWSPINAAMHSWDSPLAGHAVSPTGKGDFEILPPAVDERTEPTGQRARFPHPHWHRDDPENYPGEKLEADLPGYPWATKGKAIAFTEYEVHEPEQDAYGDWAAISVGKQHYLFGDYHPAGTHKREDMRIAWFTSPEFGEPFVFCDSIGSGHPDPDIGFAKGRFYLLNQTANDYISPGPWVDSVEVRVGVDRNGDGSADVWTDWKDVREEYAPIDGFAKRVSRQPARLDLSDLPQGNAFCFELRLTDSTENHSQPILDRLTVEFQEQAEVGF